VLFAFFLAFSADCIILFILVVTIYTIVTSGVAQSLEGRGGGVR